MSFYIGVDGGGTKTAFSLFDEDKNVVKTVYGPGSNHENLRARLTRRARLSGTV